MALLVLSHAVRHIAPIIMQAPHVHGLANKNGDMPLHFHDCMLV